MFTVKRQSGQSHSFLNIIRQRRREWSSAGKIAARIVVPPTLKWWYWQEYGVAPFKDPIVPKGPGYPLKFPGKDGTTVYCMVVKHHPGYGATHSIQKTLSTNLSIASIILTEAMLRVKGESKWRVSRVRRILVNRVMPAVKNNIVSSIAADLPGTREDGKLLGKSAADDFKDRASIVDSSGVSK